MPFVRCPNCDKQTLDPSGFLNARTGQYEEICHRCIRKEIDGGERPDQTDEALKGRRENAFGKDVTKQDKGTPSGLLHYRDVTHGLEQVEVAQAQEEQDENDRAEAEKYLEAAEKETEQAFELEHDDEVESIDEKQRRVAEKEDYRTTQDGEVLGEESSPEDEEKYLKAVEKDREKAAKETDKAIDSQHKEYAKNTKEQERADEKAAKAAEKLEESNQKGRDKFGEAAAKDTDKAFQNPFKRK